MTIWVSVTIRDVTIMCLWQHIGQSGATSEYSRLREQCDNGYLLFTYGYSFRSENIYFDKFRN